MEDGTKRRSSVTGKMEVWMKDPRDDKYIIKTEEDTDGNERNEPKSQREDKKAEVNRGDVKAGRAVAAEDKAKIKEEEDTDTCKTVSAGHGPKPKIEADTEVHGESKTKPQKEDKRAGVKNDDLQGDRGMPTHAAARIRKGGDAKTDKVVTAEHGPVPKTETEGDEKVLAKKKKSRKRKSPSKEEKCT